MMKFTLEDTTKRYKGNESCCLDDYAPSADNDYQYSCEFEFYIDTDATNYPTDIDRITKKIYILTNAEILVDTTALPKAKDKDRCMQLKPDISLEENGVEISTPISTKKYQF